MNHIDTSPAALLAVAEQFANTSTVPSNFSAVLRAIAAEKEAQPRPTDGELWDDALSDRDRYHDIADKLANAIAAHLGIDIGEHSNLNCPWLVALEALEQHHPEQPLNMVAAADADCLIGRLRTDVLWHRRRGNDTIARDCEEAANELERLRMHPAPADAPLPEPVGTLAINYEEFDVYTLEDLHQFAEAYAKAAVAAERERCAKLCKEVAERKGEKFFGQVISDGSAAQCEMAIRAQKGTV